MRDFGIVRPGTTLYIPFHTFDSNDPSASVTLTGLATSDIEIYKDGGTTQRASDAGFALLDTDGIDFDGITGIHGFSIDLADNTTAGFYAAGSQYFVVVSSVTVDAATVNFVAATFRIGYPNAILNTTIASLSSQTSFTLTSGPAEDDALNGMWCVIHDVASGVQMGKALILDYTGSTKTVTLAAGTTFTAAATDNFAVIDMAPLQPTTLGRTLDVSSGGEAGLDWANIGSPTTANNLSATNIDVDQVVASVSGAVGSVTGNVGGNVTGSVGSVATGGIVAASFAADSITAAKLAADVTTELQSGLATAAALTTVDDFLDTEIAAIKAKTDLIPAAPAAVGDIPSAATIADAVWDEDATGHQTQGTFGQAIGDPGADTDTIFGLVNTNLNATVSSRASQTSLDTLDDFVDTEVAAIKAKTDQLTFTVANQVDSNALSGGGGLDAAGVRAAVGLASANLDTQLSTIDTEVGVIDGIVDAILVDTAEIGAAGAGLTVLATQASVTTIDDFLDTEIAAIKAKTDNLPTDPADASDIAASFATVNTKLDTIDDFLDLEVAAIKAKTDNLPTDPADQSAVEAAITAATSPLATAANLGTVAGYLDTEIAAILADTNELQTDWANGGRLDLILDARASQTSVDDLPTNAELATSQAAADDATLAAIAALDTKIDAIDNFVDTEVAAVKAVTDKLDTALELDGAVYRYTTNALEQGPSGSGLDAAGVRAAVGLASANLDTQLDALPTNAELATALGTADDAVLTAIDALPTNAELATALAGADDAVLAQVALVKAKTDLIPAAPAAVGDIPTAVENADALLKRDWTSVTGEASRSVLNAMRFIRNKFSTSVTPGSVTVYEEDDTTVAYTKTLTTDANADPIVEG